jgi:phosphoribosyl-AMP cyclohydrolase
MRRHDRHKGTTSGLVQRVVEMRIDDDQDAVWLRVSLAAGKNSAPPVAMSATAAASTEP